MEIRSVKQKSQSQNVAISADSTRIRSETIGHEIENTRIYVLIASIQSVRIAAQSTRVSKPYEWITNVCAVNVIAGDGSAPTRPARKKWSRTEVLPPMLWRFDSGQDVLDTRPRRCDNNASTAWEEPSLFHRSAGMRSRSNVLIFDVIACRHPSIQVPYIKAWI